MLDLNPTTLQDLCALLAVSCMVIVATPWH